MSVLNQLFELYPKQLEAFHSPAQFCFYGGAAGGGKSHLQRVKALCASAEVPGLQTYIGRRHWAELIHNHMEGPTSFPSMVAEVNHGLKRSERIEVTETKIKFPHGSNIHLFHCQYDKDVFKLVGPEIHLLELEECTQFSEFQIRMMLSRVRMPREMLFGLSDKIKGSYPRILASGNPGGESHELWKKWFVEPYERFRCEDDPFPVWQMWKADGGRTAQFIPALVDDNPSLDREAYKESLQGLRRPELIDAMLHGKWDIPMGAFFPELDERIHRIKPFVIPAYWTRFRSFDWGSGAPFACLWIAVSDGTVPGIPEKALVCYREWYGASTFDTKQGLGLSNEQMALGIKERTGSAEVIRGTLTDSKPFAADGGRNIAEDFKYFGVPLTKGEVGPGSRIQGWQQIRGRIKKRQLFFFDELEHTWRTMTQLQTSKNAAHKGEDAETTGEDHLPDALSLAAKAYPIMTEEKQPESKVIRPNVYTMDSVIKNHLAAKRRENARIL